MVTRTVRLCVSALFTALLAVGSWITIPAAVPFTMQSFVLYVLMLLLPPTYAVASVGGYLLLGALGLPVFAGFQGGFGVLLGPLGGFLWGFLVMAVLNLLLRPSKSTATVLFLIAGTGICYVLGAVWFSVFQSAMWSFGAFASSLLMTVLPFVPVDAIKLAVAWQAAKRLKPHLPY